MAKDLEETVPDSFSGKLTQPPDSLRNTAFASTFIPRNTAFASTIFLSAFLLFQVQPVIARYVLPWYGGSPAVWSTCLLFFQVGLLAGYGYAHLLAQKVKPRNQVLVHLVLLGISLVFLPITPSESLKPTGSGNPIGGILLLLLSTVGIPFILISATNPLVQNWFRIKNQGKSPYRLYALSNLGSLLGLLTYPFLVEPSFTLRHQTQGWSVGYVLYILFCGWCGWMIWEGGLNNSLQPEEAKNTETAEGEKTSRPVLWLLLSGGGSLLLLATTNRICQDVAVIPFLWIVPLSLYLITFIIAFDSPRWYDRRIWIPLFVVFTTMAALLQGADLVTEDFSAMLSNFLDNLTIEQELVLYCAGMFSACMVLHGEMARLKPQPEKLTFFFFMTSLGGALGGVFVTFVAPFLFRGFFEYHLSIVLAWVLAGVCLWLNSGLENRNLVFKFGIGAWGVMAVAIGYFLMLDIRDFGSDALETTRNFYGVLRVTESYEGSKDAQRRLYHGVINHGVQFMAPERRKLPVAYFGPKSGIGLAITRHPERVKADADPTGVYRREHGLRVGVIGLGAGTIAAYAKPGDSFFMYEINTEVERLARGYFTFLEDAGKSASVIIGDGRISLENQLKKEPMQFDVLIADAFSGDAIPVHLITKEALAMYFRHLKPDGILVFQTTNRYIDLKPVLYRMSVEFNKAILRIVQEKDEDAGLKHAEHVILTSNQAFINDEHVTAHRSEFPTGMRKDVLWTDDYSTIAPLLKE